MRTKNSLMNISISIMSYGIIMLGGFITRGKITKILGMDFVGLNTYFEMVVSILAIAELGLGVGIVYKLYKPIAEKQWDKVSVILCFLRRCYVFIAVIISALTLVSSYSVITSVGEDFSKIWLLKVYVLYIIDLLSSYLYSHKRSMFIADQKSYVNNAIHIFAQLGMFISQILVLNLFHSFELYLICRIVSRLAENIFISYKFNKKYSFINLKTHENISGVEKKDLFKNMKALLFHKISGFGTNSISVFIIMKVEKLRGAGIFSNYNLISTALTTVTSEIFNGISASFGSLLGTSDRNKIYKNFKMLYFLNFLMYSFITPTFICLITPFVVLWTGSNSIFPISTAVSIAAYLYIYGMRQSIGMVKVSAGIYDQDKYLSLVGLFITCFSSYILSSYLGVAGVMIGNILGMLLVPYWVQPYLVYSEIFKKKSVIFYHLKFILYTALTAAYGFICYEICDFVNRFEITNQVSLFTKNLMQFMYKGSNINTTFIAQIIVNLLICILVPNILNIIIFFRTSEFRDLYVVAKSFIRRKK